MTSANIARPRLPVPARAEAATPAFDRPAGGASVALDALGDPVALLDDEGRIRTANAAFGRLLGLSVSACLDQSLARYVAAPADDVLALLSAARTSGHVHARRLTGRRASGEEFPVEASIAADADGGAGVVVTLRDASAEYRLHQALEDNRDLAEQLRRSQKIGALGRLAGGVAHDFNNLLQVIDGLAESLQAERVPRRLRRRHARHIRRTTDRAASLTRQLLAFGRRQVLVPEVLDLNGTVRSLERMLTRVIGEDVALVVRLDADLRPVLVDPGQIEQVVLNLALNARDAMRDGGTLDIATANFQPRVPWEHPALPVRVPPGAWVRLTVRDTGCGMDDATASQAFEPFFTTKDAASGSGLGLSMVYGIVKQSGGYTWIETAPSAGTMVHVLLPAVDAVPEPRGRVLTSHAAAPPARGATLLLAEDDADVRGLFSAILRRAGYVVHEAADGEDALARFDEHASEIDAVVTDVVMPSVSGPALASAIRARRPDVKVLYVSGYTEQLELGLDSAAGTALLHKPVTRTVLLGQVAALLHDGASPVPTSWPV